MKKWIIMLLMILLVSIYTPKSYANTNLTFVDVANHRAQAEISYLVTRGFVHGVTATTFVPNRQVTRGEAAAMLGRALGLSGVKRNTKFSDVRVGNFASGYVDELVRKGIISGYPDGSFQPYKVLSRGEMALLINRSFNLGGISISTSVDNLMRKGIAQGFPDGSFRTDKTIIRADFAIFLARSLNENFRVKPEGVSFSKTMYVNTGADALNMRSGPSTSDKVISSLKHGTTVNVASSKNGWSHVQVNGVIGYVSTNYLVALKPTVPAPVSTSLGTSDLKVIIDPGHGGTDPGSVANGFQEKMITLNVGKHMKNYFDQTPIATTMTRSTDVFIELSDRAKAAAKNDGDVFVSIHTNKFNGEVNGQETFYYAKTTATNPNVQESRALSIYLQARMQEAWKLTNRQVKVGNLAVLRENTVPASLTEIGFIDNSKDLQFIKSELERQRMGKALFLGTLDYFYHYEKRTDVLPYYKKAGASLSKKLH